MSVSEPLIAIIVILENYSCRRLVHYAIVLRCDAKTAEQNSSNAFQSTGWAPAFACIVLAPCIACPVQREQCAEVRAAPAARSCSPVARQVL